MMTNALRYFCIETLGWRCRDIYLAGATAGLHHRSSVLCIPINMVVQFKLLNIAFIAFLTIQFLSMIFGDTKYLLGLQTPLQGALHSAHI